MELEENRRQDRISHARISKRMSKLDRDNPAGDHAKVEIDIGDAERLICRIIDGEATESDRRAFEQLAASDASLWRRLAESQQDMLSLSSEVDEELSHVLHRPIELPTGAVSPPPANRGGMVWTGWAAAAAIAAVWLSVVWLAPTDTIAPGSDPGAGAIPALGPDRTLTPEQHLRAYLRSRHVVGELDPIMLQYEETDDGRIELRFLRRIEEAFLLDPDAPPPIDADGRLIVDPAELLRHSAGGAERN
jgi:hypothetical protein